MLQLTTEQIAKVVFKARHESRRKAKRYLKDHGGTGKADELDTVIANPTQEIEALAGRMLADRQASEAANAADLARMKPRHELAKQLRVISAALDADWQEVAELCDKGDSSCWSEKRRDVILSWGHSNDELIAARLAAGDNEGEFDDLLAIDLDDAGDLEYVLHEIQGSVERCDRDIYEETAEAALRAAAVKDGRYSVMEYYRGTLAPDGNCETLEFDDRDTACAWLLLMHDPDDYGNRTSSYSVALIDTMEGAEDNEDREDDDDPDDDDE